MLGVEGLGFRAQLGLRFKGYVFPSVCRFRGFLLRVWGLRV